MLTKCWKAFVTACNHKDYQIEIGKEVLSIDPTYFRPTEVDLLLGDPTKAKEKLGWVPEHDLASLVKDSEAEQLGLQLGDRIIKMNGKDYTAMTQEAYCELIVQLIDGSNPIMNIVISRDSEQLSFDLKDTVLIE